MPDRRQARWLVPAAAVAAVGLVIAGSALAGGQAAPRLPARTTAQLLAAVNRPAALPPAMTAVVQETASLGLPDLPGSSDATSPLSLLSGTHTFKIWYNGPAQVRVAIPVSLGETDLWLDGRSAWLWNSQANQATHYVLLAVPGVPGVPAGAGRGVSGLGSVPTPQQVAQQILAAVGKTTTVTTQQNVAVAGQAAYQLTLAPKDRRSLVGHVSIAIDAQDSLPLRVQVYARGAASPAFSVGYTSLSFTRPAASNFSFRPPPGAKVKTIPVVAGLGSSGPVGVSGPAGSGGVIAVNPASGKMTRSSRAELQRSMEERLARPQETGPATGNQEGVVPGSAPAARSSRGSLTAPRSGWYGDAPLNSGSITFSSSSPPPAGSVTYSSFGVAGSAGSSEVIGLPMIAPTVRGQGWLSVAVLPAGMGGSASGIAAALGSAATPVHGSWGGGRLLRTSLLSILLTPGGGVLVGAVQPSVLYGYISPRA
jgi:hypothetical protein